MCSSAQNHFISQAFFSLVLIKDVLYRKHLPEKCLPYLRLLSIAYSTSILRCEIILFFFHDATKMFNLLMWDDSHHHFGHSFFAGSHLFILFLHCILKFILTLNSTGCSGFVMHSFNPYNPEEVLTQSIYKQCKSINYNIKSIFNLYKGNINTMNNNPD